MDLIDDDEAGGFSFIWTIQNFSQSLQFLTDQLFSPSFVLETANSVKWLLELSLMGNTSTNYLDCFLTSDVKCTIPYRFALSIRFNNGTFKKRADQVCNNTRTATFEGIEKLVMVQECGKKVTGVYVDNDTLTLRCRMWKDDSDLLKSVRCYARTKINVEKIVYVWPLENFLARPFETRSTKVHSMIVEAPSFGIDLVYGENDRYNFKIQQFGTKQKNVSTCEISLLNANGKPTYSVRKTISFKKGFVMDCRIPFLTKKQLFKSETLYLPNGTLTLLCKFTVSAGFESNRIERTEYWNTDYQRIGCSEQMTDPDLDGSLKDCMQRLYSEEKFCDVTVRANNREFHVHKALLCARSEVFSAMFERDMMENRTGVVVIEDLDEGTVAKMLLYIYTDIIEDLDWECASELYSVADKYGITGLKVKCSAFLKSGVDVSNACGVLALADRHQDLELKLTVQRFIFEHAEEVMKSNDWKNFMEVNLPLASETMHLVIMRDSVV